MQSRPKSPIPRARRTVVQSVIASGALQYERARMLPRLLPLMPSDYAGEDPATGRRICRLLVRALRSERARGRAGHWSYDLNRHIALVQALKAERARLSPGGRQNEEARPLRDRASSIDR